MDFREDDYTGGAGQVESIQPGAPELLFKNLDTRHSQLDLIIDDLEQSLSLANTERRMVLAGKEVFEADRAVPTAKTYDHA